MKRFLTIGLMVLVLAGGIGWYFFSQTAQADSAAPRDSVHIENGTIISTVKATNRLEAETEVSLSFETSGVVSTVLVEEGQLVYAGDPLARLDDASLTLQLDQAEANLAKVKAGSHPADIAAAEAALQSALTSYQKVLAPADEEDITAAKASLSAAWSNYNALLEDPSTDELTVLAAALRNAEIDLQQAQQEYDKVSYADNLGQLPQAAQLQHTTIAYQSALANYKIAVEPAAAEKLQSAWNQVVQAQTQLDKLNNGADDEDIALAQIAVAQAQAKLDRLVETPTAEDLKVAELQVLQAQLNLSKATLIAPVDGVVTAITVTADEPSTGRTVVLADLSALHVDLLVDEIDLPVVSVGQPAVITLDALPNQPMSGQVTAIAPAPDAISTGVANYQVTVAIKEQDPQAKVGMTANVDIETGRRDNVAVISTDLLQVDTSTGQPYVEKPGADGLPVRADVTLGLRSGQKIEVLNGLKAGDMVFAPVVKEITVKMQSGGAPGFNK